MRIEYWGRIRLKSGSYYLTLPSAIAKSLAKEAGTPLEFHPKDVKVEVTL